FDHVGLSLRALGLGATHGSEIVHVHHSYGSYLGRMIHPMGRRRQPSVGRRMQRAGLDFATDAPAADRPRHGMPRRATRVIRSIRDVVVDEPDSTRRAAWAGLY